MNSYQHKPFLDQQVKDRGYKIVPVGLNVNFPIGIFLKTNDQGGIDCEGSEPDVLQSVVYAADAVACAVHAGMGAIGNLVVCAAPNFEDGIVGCDAVEALGWLLSELGDLGASAAAVSV